MTEEPSTLSLEDLDIPEGWTAVSHIPSFRPNTPFLSSAERVTVRYFKTEVDGEIRGFIRMGRGTQGPPGHAHGGSMASVLDEAMGFACWIHDRPVLAARIEVDFRAPLPIPAIVSVRGAILSIDGRKIRTEAILTALDGTVYSEASGLFVQLSRETIAKMG
ncbi:MAG: PaaI family thioesterase [Myxococcota bacterium]